LNHSAAGIGGGRNNMGKYFLEANGYFEYKAVIIDSLLYYLY